MYLLLMLIAVSQAYQYHKLLAEKFVLDVVAKCNLKPTGVMEVGVITDLNVAVTAVCKNNFTLEVESFDNVHYWFYPSFSGDPSTMCVFDKQRGSDHYTLLVQAQWGEPETKVRPVVQQYLVTCGYSDHGMNVSNIEQIGDSLVAPTEIQTHKGNNSNSTITLRMVSILGEDITGKIPRGKLVKLQGHSDGAGGEQGLTAVSCDAVGDNGVRYSILRAGCGDGIVFGKTEGFLTQGLDVISPYFAVFNVKGSSLMKFHCNFTVCLNNCDGSSCRDVTVKRRSARDVTGTGNINTSTELRSSAGGPISGDRDSRHVVPWWQPPFVILILSTVFILLIGGVAVFICRRHVETVYVI